MGLFERNPNETAYQGGKKHWTDVIKNSGPANTLIWRQPEEELIGIEAYLEELSQQIEPYIDDILKNYGLKCISFSLSGLDIDTTKYDKIDEFQIESKRKINNAQGDKAVMEILGDNWEKQQNFNILGDLAKKQNTRFNT